MNNLSLEKIQYLIKGLTGKDIPLNVLQSVTNDKVDLKNFQRACNAQAGIPMPLDPRSEKYKDITLYSDKTFMELATEKYPDGLQLHLENVDAKSLLRYIENDYFSENEEYTARLDAVPDNPEMLDVRMACEPDRYHILNPDPEVYRDSEMDEWIEDRYGSTLDWLVFRSENSNFVKQHPDLAGGSLRFYEPDRNFHLKLTVEGRPFHEALSIVMRKPHISTSELKSLLQDPQRLQQFMKADRGVNTGTDNSAEVLVRNGWTYVYQHGINGFMAVDRNRNLHEYGEKLGDRCRSSFQKIVDGKQLIQGKDRLFFHDYNNDRPEPVEELFFNTRTGETKALEKHLLWNGGTVYAEAKKKWDKVIPDKETMKDMVRLKDRVTDVEIHVNSPKTMFERVMVRCKVDGEQQQFVNMPNRLKDDYNYFSRPEMKERIVEKFLAEEYKDMLMNRSPERQQSKGVNYR